MLGPWIKANWKWSNEMARVNINILGISQLKWTGMGEFNSDDNYIYYCGQESLRKNGTDIIVNKRVINAVLGCKENELCSFPRQTIQYHSNPSLCPTRIAEAEVEWFYEDLQGLLDLTPKKSCSFHYRGLECKSRKSRNIWSNRQIWLWSTEWSRAKANKSCAKRKHWS